MNSNSDAGGKSSAKIELNYSRGRVKLPYKRVRLLNKFFYDIINIENVLTQLVSLI
jgi:hypothetical protein